MRIGIDLGGTKIEALALDEDGRELARHRIDTPREDYAATVAAMASLVHRLEAETGQTGTVGAGIPGTIRRANGLVKNANSTWLNGRPLRDDLGQALGREVRVENDANCLAVSEATDGAAAGFRTVFAVILGTGCGGGLALDARVHTGPNGVAGEWGHNPLPWPLAGETPGAACYCGRFGCLEKWVSGTGISDDYFRTTGKTLVTREIAARAEAGDAECLATLERFEDRLARGLASMVHVLDPDAIVVGGGVSRIARTYRNLPALMHRYTFGGTSIRRSCRPGLGTRVGCAGRLGFAGSVVLLDACFFTRHKKRLSGLLESLANETAWHATTPRGEAPQRFSPSTSIGMSIADTRPIFAKSSHLQLSSG